MVVLIYGSHRVSEPLAYEVGKKVLQRVPTIKGIEDPHFQDSDWILLFNQFCEGIRNGSLKYQIHNFQDFLSFATKKQKVDNEWSGEIARTHIGQAIYDLHDRFNPGALDRWGIDKLIAGDSPTLKYRPNDGTLAVVEVAAVKTDAYPNNVALIEELSQIHRLKVLYEKRKFFPNREVGSIEINLPDDLPKFIGVNPENKEDLEKCVENEVERRK